jgi:micrococcal nuclease
MYTYAAKLIEVVDGDTVDLLIDLGFGVHVKERCRLYGIDAPEMPTEQGQAAKAYLESLIGAATGELFVATRKMARKPKERTDKYGRYLAVLYDGSHTADMFIRADQTESSIAAMRASINWEMVSVGHAKERYW